MKAKTNKILSVIIVLILAICVNVATVMALEKADIKADVKVEEVAEEVTTANNNEALEVERSFEYRNLWILVFLLPAAGFLTLPLLKHRQ